MEIQITKEALKTTYNKLDETKLLLNNTQFNFPTLNGFDIYIFLYLAHSRNDIDQIKSQIINCIENNFEGNLKKEYIKYFSYLYTHIQNHIYLFGLSEIDYKCIDKKYIDIIASEKGREFVVSTITGKVLKWLPF